MFFERYDINSMTKSRIDCDNNFRTTNRDYGSFYFGRIQHRQANPDEVAFELRLNDQVRNERGQLPSIAYDIMFDVGFFFFPY